MIEPKEGFEQYGIDNISINAVGRTYHLEIVKQEQVEIIKIDPRQAPYVECDDEAIYMFRKPKR